MALDKFAGLFASSAQSMANSARSIEHFAEMMESQMETQNALLTTLIDKLGSGKAGTTAGKAGTTAGGGVEKNEKASLKDTANSLGQIASILPALIKGLIKFPKKSGFKFIRFINDLSEVVNIASAKKYAAYSTLLISLSQSIGKIATGLFKFRIFAGKKGVDNFISFVERFSESLKKIDHKTIRKSTRSIDAMASAIVGFGFTLLIASAAYAIIGPLAMLTVIPVIAGFAYVFYKVGKAGDSIEKGAKAIAWMALAIVGMGLAMMITMKLAGGSWGDFVKGALFIVAGIAVFGLVFDMVGSMENDIEKGAKAVAWMGLAIISLAVGLGIWQLFNIDFSTILYTAAGVALVGIAFGIIGIFASYIEEGAFAMLWTGVAIGILAIGIGAFKLFGINWDDLALVGAAVTGTGLLFAGAGLLGPVIALGAIALLLAGAAMIVLSLGILALSATYKFAMDGLFASSKQDTSKTNMTVMIDAIVDAFSIDLGASVKMLLGAIGLIFVSIAMITLSVGIWALEKHALSTLFDSSGADPKKTNIQLMVDSIVDAFSINPIDSIFMLLGAVGLIFVSIAMITLSAGIWAISKHVDSNLFKSSSIDKDRTGISVMIDSIVDAFSINPIDSIFMMVGSVALILASVAMLIVSAGLWAIGKHADSELFKTSEFDKDRTTMGVIFGSIVGAMALGVWDLAALYTSVPAWLMVGASLMMIGSGVADFIKLYEKGIDPTVLSAGLATVLTGIVNAIIDADKDADWDGVEDGLDAISGVGAAITGIAEGVQAFAELKFPNAFDENGKPTGYLTLNDKVFGNVTTNMKLMIGAVTDALASAGKGASWFNGNAAEEGAKAIKGIGNDLVGIAKFVVMAADLRIPMYDATGKLLEGQTTKITNTMLGKKGSVYWTIRKMIEAVSSALMMVGNKESESDGWFTEGDVTKGKTVIMGVGKSLKDIADAVIAASQIKDMKTAKYKIKMMLLAIPTIFKSIVPAFEEAKTTNKIVIDSLNSINEPLSATIDVLAKAEKSKLSEKTGAAVGKSIAAIFTAIASLDGNVNVDKFQPVLQFVKELAEVADPLTKLADSFEKLAKNMDKFVQAYKGMDKQSMDKHKLLIDSLVVFSKVDANALNAVSDRGKQLLDYINGGGPKEAPVLPPGGGGITPAPKGATKQSGTKDVKDTKAKQGTMDTAAMEQLLGDIKTAIKGVKTALLCVKVKNDGSFSKD